MGPVVVTATVEVDVVVLSQVPFENGRSPVAIPASLVPHIPGTIMSDMTASAQAALIVRSSSHQQAVTECRGSA